MDAARWATTPYQCRQTGGTPVQPGLLGDCGDLRSFLRRGRETCAEHYADGSASRPYQRKTTGDGNRAGCPTIRREGGDRELPSNNRRPGAVCRTRQRVCCGNTTCSVSSDSAPSDSAPTSPAILRDPVA